MNNKGFLLIDSLICIFVVSQVCILCINIYKLVNNYDDLLIEYQERSNEKYEYLYHHLGVCIKCQTEDSFTQEP